MTMSKILKKSVSFRLAGALKPYLEIGFRFQKDEDAQEEVKTWSKEIRGEFVTYIVEEAKVTDAAKKMMGRIPGLAEVVEDPENFGDIEFFWETQTEEGDNENIVFSDQLPEAVTEFIIKDEVYRLILEIQELEEDLWYNQQGDKDGIGLGTHSTVDELIDTTHLLLSYRSAFVKANDFDKVLTFGTPAVPKATVKEIAAYKTHLEQELS
jgi:hypothetical protein